MGSHWLSDPEGVTGNSQGFQPLDGISYNGPMPIILFDIDGTLVRTGGAGKFAMESALVSAFGVAELRDEVPYSGRTDVAITRDLLRVHGIDPTPLRKRTPPSTQVSPFGSSSLAMSEVRPLLPAVPMAPGAPFCPATPAAPSLPSLPLGPAGPVPPHPNTNKPMRKRRMAGS